MTSVSILAIVLFFWIRFRAARGPIVPPRISAFAPPLRLACACAYALVPLMLVQAWILVSQVSAEQGPPLTEWHKHLPIPVFDGRSYRHGVHVWYSYAALAVALLETGCVATVVTAARFAIPRGLGVAMCFAGAGMLAIALGTPAMATTDPYEYAATSILGFAAYAPPPGAFAGTAYAPILPHLPIRGVIYGPLWVAFDTFVLALVPTILGKLVVLRVVNAALLGVFAYVLTRARVPGPAIVALLVNPAVWYYVVLSPHADIDGLLLIGCALLAAQRSRSWLAMAFLAAAGSVKITFLVAGAAVLAPLSDPRKRGLAWAGAIALAAGASLFVPHNGYVSSVATYVPHSRFLTKETVSGQWMIVAALAGASVVLLVFGGKRTNIAPWLFGQLAPLAAPWYLLWGLPYALVGGSAAVLLGSLPLTAALLDLNFDMTPFPLISILACVAGYGYEVWRSSTPPNAALPSPNGPEHGEPVASR